MDFIIDSNTTSSNNNIINGISDNIVYNSFLISNINITSNYASNISNVLKTNIDNNLANNSNFTSGTGFNTSNYASNISNILLNLINTNSGSSNYSLNISNILKTNIDANNTTTNTAIGNTSNYASNISNILLNLINTNSGSSNYSLNISNILKTNIDANNTTTNTAIGNTSNYASNISNVLLTNINTNYLQKTGGNITGNTNINGIVNINNGAGYAITYGYMQSGSLTIGGTNVNYGGNFYTTGAWNGTNTAGLLMECANNTEIAIHDNATRLASLMYYEGVDNKITLGRNMGWGAISTIVINGNTGIGTINPSSKLHIEHSSTSLNTSNGGLYVYNPNNTATSSSVIGTRISGTSANKASISLDVLNNYGWSIYITGNDTVDKCLRFNSSCDTTGLDRLKIRGSDGYTNINGGCRISNDLTVDGTINAPSILINNLNISNSIINNNTYTSNISNVLQTNINTTNNNLSTNYYNQTQTNTLITNTSNYAFNISNILLNVINTNSGTGSSNYASNISNVLQTNINTTNNNLATNYLQLAGGTMTGPITTNSTTGGSLIILKTSSTVATTSILLQNNLSIYGNIGLGCSAYNNNYASNLFIETTYDILINSGNYSTIPKMIFKSSGNIGIGTTDPGTNILQIGGGGRLRIGSGDSDYTLIGTTNNDDGIFNYSATTTKIFLAGNNCTASGIGCIKYYATTNQGCHIFYAGNAERFKIDNGGNLYNNGSLINFSSYATNTTLTTNYYNKTDIDTNITNNSNYATNISNVLQGNINTTNTNISTNYFPKAGGTMTGTLNISSLNTKLSFGSRTQDYLIDLYNGVYGIGVNDYVMRYNAWDLASHKFYSGTSNTASISSNGILTIAAVNIGSVSINNWLFNSSGFNHETISDFNNITGFGYRFINGIGSAPTNGPATGDTQYYSWYIGLGAEYPAISGSSSYGMQFAIGRHDVNPKLCIRRKQDNSWTSWQGLTAEKAVSLTSGDKTISGQLQILASMYNGLYITNTNSNDIVSIELRNNTTYSSFIGIGCTAYTGNYKNNLFIQSPQSLILNTNGNATSATPNFIINTSGNVGIGTTNPTEDLHIYGNDNAFIKVDAVGGTGQSGLRLFAGSGTSNRATRIDFFNNVASITQARWSMLNDTDQNGTNDFRIYNAGGSSNILTLLQSGNIGIGTINPLQKLHIEGALYLTGIPSNPGNNVSASFWNQGNVGPTISGYAIAFQTNGTTERMRIDNNGNVGIGITNPTCKLSLGSSVGYKLLSLYDNGLNNNFQFVGLGAQSGLCFNNFGTGDAFQFRVGTSTTAANELMRINGNGSVCIGTASATSVNTKLTISGTSTAASQPIVRIEQLGTWNGSANNYAFQVSGYSDLGGIRINGTDDFNTIFTTGNNDMGLSTNTGVIKFLTNTGYERMRILNNGNVGIGTNNSSSKLTVEGRTITGNGSSTYSSVFSDNTVGLTVANAAGIGNPQQLVICDTSNANTALLLGTKYNAGDTYSIIQSIVAGAGYKTLCLNPYGGNIGIGTTNPSCRLSLGSLVGYKVLSLWDNGETNDFKFNGFGANLGLCFNVFSTTTDSFQFRAGVNSTSANELMRLSGTGNLSLGTTNTASYKMRIRGTNPTFLRIETDTDAVSQVSGIEFGIPGFSSAGSAKITSTTYGGDVNDLSFSTSSAANSTSVKMTINGNGNISCTNNFTAGGNVGIGTTNPNNILQVGDGGKFRISNGISDYTLIGTKDTDGATNTRIVISGNTRGSYGGGIEYVATSSTGNHVFYSSDNTNYTERMRILNNGNVGIGTATPNRNFEVFGTNPALVIRAADEIQTSTLFLGTGHINISAYKCAIIAEGYTGWSRSRLHFCLNNNGASNEYPTYNATIADAKMTILPSGDIGIGTVTPLSKLHIEHSSTTFNAAYGGLYLYNPNTSSTSCSCLGARINGSTANKAGLSLDVSGYYGWSMYINGNDTTDRQLRFNSTWDGSGTEILQIRGSDGYATFSGNMQIGSKTSQKGTGPASLLIGDSTGTSSLILTNVANAVWKIDTLNLCLNFYNDTTTSGTFVNKMQITKAGNLLVSGDISAFANMSDKRLKHNITNLSINCIDLLNNIKPVEFIWNDMDEIINIKRNTYDHGFIAQDIEILLPNIVNQYDKYKSIKYEKLTPYLVKGFQELYKLIQEQQQQIIDLQNQINMIKSQLS